MTRYSLAPGYITVNYQTTIGGVALPHHMRFQILPEAPAWVNVNIMKNDGATPQLWTAAVDAIIVLLRPLWNASTSFIDAQLHRQDTASSAPILVANWGIALAGSAAGADVASVEDKYIFRSTNGNLYYSMLMEDSSLANTVLALGGLSAARQAWVNYVKGATSVIKARDNGLPTTFLRAITKTNDKTRKLRLQL